jgi:hypothetical protein
MSSVLFILLSIPLVIAGKTLAALKIGFLRLPW